MPQLYDFDTYIMDLPVQTYYKIGNIRLLPIYISGGTLKGITISSLIEIRNFPVTIIGASGFLRFGTWTSGDGTINIQLDGKQIFLRSGGNHPSNGANAKGTFSNDTDMIQLFAIGVG